MLLKIAQAASQRQTCLKQLTDNNSSGTKISLLASMKDSNHQNINANLATFLTNIASIFNQNFETLLANSVVIIKAKLLQIKNTGNFDLLCEQCRDRISDKYLNMLIGGKVRVLKETLKKKTKKN